MNQNHRLFREFPITDRVLISCGEVPVPYHIYNGRNIFIGGTADFGAVQRLLADEAVVPLRTADGAACMGMWLCVFDDANLGPHHELQISFFVAERNEPIPAHPLGLLAALILRSDVKVLCHGLSNNTPNVVAYNREVLSLDAHLSSSRIDVASNGVISFDVRAGDSDAMLVSGVLAPTRYTTWRAGWDLVSLIGFSRLWRVNRQPWTPLRVVNTRRMGVPENLAAETYTAYSANRLRYFNASQDVLNLHAASYAEIGFQPRFVQSIEGFKLVYMQPRALA
jgi:hypothetical protein